MRISFSSVPYVYPYGPSFLLLTVLDTAEGFAELCHDTTSSFSVHVIISSTRWA